MTPNCYLWETHMHTAETSICGRSPAAEMVAAYHRAGYHGIVITDHFINGNSYARRKRSWEKRIDAMMKGFEAAQMAGRALGVVVLMGCEFSWQGGDFLTYGIDEAFLRDQPDLAELNVDTYVRRVHGAGGFVSQAHPFRSAWYMPANVEKRWDIVDGIEVFNGSHPAENRRWDDDALALAEAHHLVQTAGSDAHSLEDVGTAALAFAEPAYTADALVRMMQRGRGVVVRNRE